MILIHHGTLGFLGALCLLELEGCGARAFGEGPAAPVLEGRALGVGGFTPHPLRLLLHYSQAWILSDTQVYEP